MTPSHTFPDLPLTRFFCLFLRLVIVLSQASSDVTTDLWERGKVAAGRAGEAGLGLAEQAGDALGFSVALTAASRNSHAQQVGRSHAFAM